MHKRFYYNALPADEKSAFGQFIIAITVFIIGPLGILLMSFENSFKEGLYTQLSKLNNVGKEVSQVWFEARVANLNIPKGIYIRPAAETQLIKTFVQQHEFFNHVQLIETPSIHSTNFKKMVNNIKPIYEAIETIRQPLFYLISYRVNNYYSIATPILNELNALATSFEFIHTREISKSSFIDLFSSRVTFFNNKTQHQQVYKNESEYVFYAFIDKLMLLGQQEMMLVSVTEETLLNKGWAYKLLIVIIGIILLMFFIYGWLYYRLFAPLKRLTSFLSSDKTGQITNAPIITQDNTVNQLLIALRYFIDKNTVQYATAL